MLVIRFVDKIRRFRTSFSAGAKTHLLSTKEFTAQAPELRMLPRLAAKRRLSALSIVVPTCATPNNPRVLRNYNAVLSDSLRADY